MDSNEITKLYQDLQSEKNTSVLSQTLPKNPLLETKNKRPLSVSIEDAFFGDSGKGRVTVEFNQILAKKAKLFSVRYNGGANAGHECYMDDKVIVTHQLPMALIEDGATGIMGRGVVLHPDDLLTELTHMQDQFGGKLPGTLLIDDRAVLSLDTHRAFETLLNNEHSGGRGSTGRGIATAYGSFYERIAVTVKDLMSKDWQDIFSRHYDLYTKLSAGFGTSLDTIEVTTLQKGKRPVGTKKDFLARLSHARGEIASYVSSEIFTMLQDAWKNPKIAFTFEGAQGGGLDPYHGVYPDVTASRPTSRNINDTTYNIVDPNMISLRLAVMKTTYMSSVGIRKLPTQQNQTEAKWFQTTFDEKGRSTGRLRDIYEVSIPIGRYIRAAGQFDYLVATHLDASLKDQKISVVTHYTDKKTKKEVPYLPYQDYLDTLDAHVVSFSGWDGNALKYAKSPKDLPTEARTYLAFLSQTIAPVAFGTTNPQLGSYISWLPKL